VKMRLEFEEREVKIKSKIKVQMKESMKVERLKVNS
jgi:hypothetical protein